MGTFRVGPPRLSSDAGFSRVSSTLVVDDNIYDIWFQSADAVLNPSGNVFLAGCLVPAMKLGNTLEIQAPVSVELIHAVDKIQRIFSKWYPELHRIEIHCPTYSGRTSAGKWTGSFFSGGVDSFYTLLKNIREIDKVIFVHGFDVALDNMPLRDTVSSQLKRAAVELNKSFIQIETNLRSLGHMLQWDLHYFGSALVSVAFALCDEFMKIFIPASETYAHLDPCASHPLVDEIWNCDEMQLVHDGCEASRVEKCARLSESDVAMSALRVCWQNPGNEYNCSKCEKCLRTMINLEIAGALDKNKTFLAGLDYAAVEHIKIETDLVLNHYEDNLAAAATRRKDPALQHALKSCIDRYKRQKLIEYLKENLEGILESEEWRTFVDGKRNTLFKALWRQMGPWLTAEVVKENLKRIAGRSH